MYLNQSTSLTAQQCCGSDLPPPNRVGRKTTFKPIYFRSAAYQQQGFSLPLAIFILVVVSLLAAAIYRMSAVNQNSVVQEVLSTRAFLAAESGAQAQMMRIFPLSGSALCAAQSLSLSTAAMNGCTISSNCIALSVNGQSVYNIESTGRCVIAGFTAQRVIEVQAKAP